MGFDYLVCAMIGAVALVYLLAALMRPEKF